MHSAPAVSYPVGRSRFQGGLLCVASVVGVLAGMVWLRQSTMADWRHGVSVMTWLVTSGLAFHAWRLTPCGVLCWDGHGWAWTSETTSARGVVTVHLDAQDFLLLSLHTEAGARFWLWPARRPDGVQWHALRCAVFAHPRLHLDQTASTPTVVVPLSS